MINKYGYKFGHYKETTFKYFNGYSINKQFINHFTTNKQFMHDRNFQHNKSKGCTKKVKWKTDRQQGRKYPGKISLLST